MGHDEMVFEVLKSIAPKFVDMGVDMISRCTAAGADARKCTVGDSSQSIWESYSAMAVEWAEEIVKAYEK